MKYQSAGIQQCPLNCDNAITLIREEAKGGLVYGDEKLR
jgi:hypothetical protein